MDTVKIAMIGVGNISGIYLENITRVFREIELVGVCDLVWERAAAAREKYGIPKQYKTMYDAFDDGEVDVILNLTRPCEHYEVSRAALMAGKHVYSEKPLAAGIEKGRELVRLAAQRGLLLCGAPDTFLGAGIQTCRRLIDQGMIGQVVGSAAFMIGHGPESWHPDPDFFYQYGGGPMMDMGPYYLTAMVNLVGGIKRVFAAGRRSFEKRLITSAPLCGTPIAVNVDTYVAGTVEYATGAVGTLFTTFDVYHPEGARFEVYGAEGTLFVPDPNTFGGPVRLLRREDGQTREIPLMFDYQQNSRALGLADMAHALLTHRAPRAGCRQTLHVLEAIEGFARSARTGEWVELESDFERQPPMAGRRLPGVVD